MHVSVFNFLLNKNCERESMWIVLMFEYHAKSFIELLDLIFVKLVRKLNQDLFVCRGVIIACAIIFGDHVIHMSNVLVYEKWELYLCVKYK